MKNIVKCEVSERGKKSKNKIQFVLIDIEDECELRY